MRRQLGRRPNAGKFQDAVLSLGLPGWGKSKPSSIRLGGMTARVEREAVSMNEGATCVARSCFVLSDDSFAAGHALLSSHLGATSSWPARRFLDRRRPGALGQPREASKKEKYRAPNEDQDRERKPRPLAAASRGCGGSVVRSGARVHVERRGHVGAHGGLSRRRARRGRQGGIRKSYARDDDKPPDIEQDRAARRCHSHGTPAAT